MARRSCGARTRGAIVARLEHELAATDVSFSPDGRFLLTGSDEGWTRAWEISSGTQLLRVAGLRAAWAADGRFFATVDERTGRVWACEVCRGIDGLLRLADERVTRPLTAAERARYLHE
jgi:WD40 repeat protein